MPGLEFLYAFGREVMVALYEGGLWILVGFVVAGILHVWVDPSRLARHLGDRSLGAALRGAVIGAPIPLCSCAVLPAAIELRKKGASREATLSFLITTPEVGVDAVAFTTAYFGPVMGVIRPLVAIVTGVVAGALSLRMPDDGRPLAAPPCRVHPDGAPAPDAAHDHDHDHDEHAHHGHDHGDPLAADAPATPETFVQKLRRGMRYSFVDLFDDLGFWLAFALVLTGFLSALLPADFFDTYFPSSIAAMALMVVLGAPMYVCASASTPLAAMFVAKGASAGAALVFLLVGPPMNGATLATVRRFLGPEMVRVYLGSIIGVAMAAGLLVDLLLPDLGDMVRLGEPLEPEVLAPLKTLGMLVFTWYLVRSLRRTGLRAGLHEMFANVRDAAAWGREIDLMPLLRSRITQAVLAVWVAATLLEGIHRVPPGQLGLVRRFGALEGAPRQPGLVYALPFIDELSLVKTDAVRERPINFLARPGSLERDRDPEATLYVTADENLIDIHAEVQYRAADPVRFRLEVEDPDAVLGAVTRAQLLQAMALHPIDATYTRDRAEVETWLLGRVRADAERLGLGLSIVSVRLLDVHAPDTVHEAFRDVASAHEDRLTTIHQATEYANGVVAVARGEAEKLVAESQAWAMQRLVQAHGDSYRFLALAEVHQQAPALTEARLYVETAERVLPGARKVIRATDDGPQGYELWLRGEGMGQPAPAIGPAVAAKPRTPPSMEELMEEDDE
ncbi:MAG: SO_0444 family Cu/Zn efflux transporter [bacterium]|nr:SO_0444 family Cu/Zn efflux transporter [bacterium]